MTFHFPNQMPAHKQEGEIDQNAAYIKHKQKKNNQKQNKTESALMLFQYII